MPQIDTVFENHRKRLILQHCERSELRLQKFIKNAKNSQFDEFWKTKACSQSVLPDRSILVWQK